jgi:hypothetical protein
MPWRGRLCELLETRKRRFQSHWPHVAEVNQARQYVFGFRAKPHLILVLKLSKQSVTAKALPLIEIFVLLGQSR